MAKVKSIGNNEFGQKAIWCEGCKEMHVLNTIKVGDAPCWGFNNDYEKPTFTPSLLVRSGHYVPGESERIAAGKGSCWCEYQKAHPEITDAPKCGVCHTFITDGNIQYLPDCTHELAGQTVPLKDLENLQHKI